MSAKHSPLKQETIKIMKKTQRNPPPVSREMAFEQRQQEEQDVNVLIKNLRKEHEKDILIHGIFIGVLIGSLLTGIMIHLLEKL